MPSDVRLLRAWFAACVGRSSNVVVCTALLQLQLLVAMQHMVWADDEAARAVRRGVHRVALRPVRVRAASARYVCRARRCDVECGS